MRSPKKVGPDINPTEPMKKMSPIFSIIFNAFAEISTFSSLCFCETVSLIWSENIAPKRRAIINTPALPKLTPLIFILPNNNPMNIHIKLANITKGTPWIKITPLKIFIF